MKIEAKDTEEAYKHAYNYFREEHNTYNVYEWEEGCIHVITDSFDMFQISKEDDHLQFYPLEGCSEGVIDDMVKELKVVIE